MSSIVVKTKSLAVGTAFLMLAACSGHPTSSDLAKEQADTERVRVKEEAKLAKLHNEQIESQADEYPAWVIEPPKHDATGVYGVGVGVDPDIQVAIKKSRITAEFAIASQINQSLSGSEKLYVSDNTGAGGASYAQAIEKLIAEVPVVGYDVVERTVKPIGGKAHCFTLIKMPYEALNKGLRSLRAVDTSAEESAAFTELQRKLANLKASAE